MYTTVYSILYACKTIRVERRVLRIQLIKKTKSGTRNLRAKNVVRRIRKTRKLAMHGKTIEDINPG